MAAELATPLARMAPAGAGGGRRPASAAFVRSVMPALDLAFGLEDLSACPDAIAVLVARLHAGPLGRPRRPAAAAPAWSAGLIAEAA